MAFKIMPSSPVRGEDDGSGYYLKRDTAPDVPKERSSIVVLSSSLTDFTIPLIGTEEWK